MKPLKYGEWFLKATKTKKGFAFSATLLNSKEDVEAGTAKGVVRRALYLKDAYFSSAEIALENAKRLVDEAEGRYAVYYRYALFAPITTLDKSVIGLVTRSSRCEAGMTPKIGERKVKTKPLSSIRKGGLLKDTDLLEEETGDTDLLN